jgi:hypothetical protein
MKTYTRPTTCYSCNCSLTVATDNEGTWNTSNDSSYVVLCLDCGYLVGLAHAVARPLYESYFNEHGCIIELLSSAERCIGVRGCREKKDTSYKEGVICCQCNYRNEFGVPNRSDGTYVCYNCR